MAGVAGKGGQNGRDPTTPVSRLRRQTSGVVLAGGRARRMGGVDKGLVPFSGRPLIAYALEALAPLCVTILINTNRSQEAYRKFGFPLVADPIEGFAGPLAGVLAALERIETPYLLVIPCDAPALTPEILGKLLVGLVVERAEIAIASDGDRLHPVVMAVRRDLRESLRDYLTAGGRKIDRWTANHDTVVVPFPSQKEAFCNLNTPEELAELERRWRERG